MDARRSWTDHYDTGALCKQRPKEQAHDKIDDKSDEGTKKNEIEERTLILHICFIGKDTKMKVSVFFALA